MNDDGLAAAMNMALAVFQQCSRASGRSSRTLESARPGDVIVTATNQERRRLEYELYAMGKPNVRVIVASVEPGQTTRIAPKPSGAVIFDHMWIAEYWQCQMTHISNDLRALQIEVSRRAPPEQLKSEMAHRFESWSKPGQQAGR